MVLSDFPNVQGRYSLGPYAGMPEMNKANMNIGLEFGRCIGLMRSLLPGGSTAQIRFQHLGIVQQGAAAVSQHDLAGFQYIAALGNA